MISAKLIPPELTYDIRHIVLRAGLPRETCYWETDRLPGVFHLGGWLDGRQVGVATFQLESESAPPGSGHSAGPCLQPDTDIRSGTLPPYRLRGMAVLPEARGCGVGALMLLAGEDRVRRMGIHRLWCDARIGAAAFYERYGWTRYGDVYEIPTAGPHYRMRKEISDDNQTVCAQGAVL